MIWKLMLQENLLQKYIVIHCEQLVKRLKALAPFTLMMAPPLQCDFLLQTFFQFLSPSKTSATPSLWSSLQSLAPCPMPHALHTSIKLLLYAWTHARIIAFTNLLIL